MVELYVKRIIAGKMALANVPEKWKAEVKKKLKELGVI